MEDDHDLIIIGAGLYGIQAARTYLEEALGAQACFSSHDPPSECDDNLYAATERMYDAFWSQTPVGMAEFSDRPLLDPPRDQDYYGFFPAKYVTKYLEDYADIHVYAGLKLRDRILFNCHVNAVSKEDAKWIISCEEKGSPRIFNSSKLMVATGLSSEPRMPVLPNQHTFKGLVLHHRDFGQSDFLASSDAEHICVYGGAKSAADVVYASAKAGKTVSWIIRENGSGPSALAPAQGSGPYRNANESIYTRMASLLNPSLFVPQIWVTRFLHQNRIGRKFVGWLWAEIDAKNRRLANYGRPDGRANKFEELEPDTPMFWQNDSTGINQRPDFWDTIAHNVHIHRQDITSLNPTSIALSDGTTIPTDVLVCATGWRNSLSIFSAADTLCLGLPTPIPSIPPKSAAKWTDLYATADKSVLSTFPSLAQPPPHREPPITHSPYRLYRMLAPIRDPDRSIVFLGHMVVGNNFRAAECQALWATAYLDGNLALPSTEAMEVQIAVSNAWNRRRYLGKGIAGNWFYYDLVPYTDVLLREVGVRPRDRGWWARWFAPCVAGDLKRVVEDYMALRR